MFTVAEAALANNKQLIKVVIMEHAPRYDTQEVDPSGVKPKLANFANSTMSKMWHSSAMRNRIVLGKHSLSCNTDDKDSVYTAP